MEEVRRNQQLYDAVSREFDSVRSRFRSELFPRLIKKRLDDTYSRIMSETKPKPEDEQSVLEKMLKVDKHVAFVMATDMFFAGVDTVS